MIYGNVNLYAALVFFLILVASYIFTTRRYTEKLAKLGSAPRKVPHYFPFGFDRLWEAIKYNQRNADIDLVYKYLDKAGSNTFQVTVY